MSKEDHKKTEVSWTTRRIENTFYWPGDHPYQKLRRNNSVLCDSLSIRATDNGHSCIDTITMKANIGEIVQSPKRFH